MERMTKKERVRAALACAEVDRLPIGMWSHYPDKDQDPRSLAETQVHIMQEYDLDFIKLCPFGLYTVQDWGCKIKIFGTPTDPPIVDDYGIKTIDDWETLEELPASCGTWGKQLQAARYMRKLVKDVPFVQTIFSPITTAYKLAGDRLFQDIKDEPKLIHQALQIITNTTINFIKANIEAGVSGFFMPAMTASLNYMTSETYDQFGSKYDLQLLNQYKDKTFFNIIHIHGENAMFEKLIKYPANCVNWDDRLVGPSLKEARKLTDKCLMGGIYQKETLAKGTPKEIKNEIHEAINSVGRKGYIVAPGCVTDPRTPPINYYAARLAVENM